MVRTVEGLDKDEREPRNPAATASWGGQAWEVVGGVCLGSTSQIPGLSGIRTRCISSVWSARLSSKVEVIAEAVSLQK